MVPSRYENSSANLICINVSILILSIKRNSRSQKTEKVNVCGVSTRKCKKKCVVYFFLKMDDDYFFSEKKTNGMFVSKEDEREAAAGAEP